MSTAKHHSPAYMQVTLLLSPDEARKAIEAGGFNVVDFFQGQETLPIRYRADLTDAAAYGLHVLLDGRPAQISGPHQTAPPNNTNKKPE